MQRIQTEMEALQDLIDALEGKVNRLTDYEFAGRVLKTKEFGTVQIDRHTGNYLYFEAKGQTCKFVLPGCITDGFMIPDDLEMVQRYKAEKELLK